MNIKIIQHENKKNVYKRCLCALKIADYFIFLK
jgi:hypothetical protein